MLEAIKNGASGYLVKSASLDELISAVRRTAEGDAVFSAGLAGLVLGEYRRMELEPDQPRLTERETEVVALIAHGLSNAEIAGRLVLAEQTVKTHVGRILNKLQLRDRTQVAVFAYETGLVRPGDPPSP